MRKQPGTYGQTPAVSEEQALSRLTALCARAEHCSGEMLDKMARWGVHEEAQARIMEHLINNRYIDDERYCRAFVREKMEFNGWGRYKIDRALYAKHIGSELRNAVLDEIGDDEFVAILRPLIAEKRRRTQARSDYEMKMKLVRFAISRGFSYDQIGRCVDVPDEF